MNTRRCASKDAGPQRGVDWGVSHRLEKGTNANEDARPQRGGLGVPHRLEKETSANEDPGPCREVDCEISHRLGRRTKHSL